MGVVPAQEVGGRGRGGRGAQGLPDGGVQLVGPAEDGHVASQDVVAGPAGQGEVEVEA